MCLYYPELVKEYMNQLEIIVAIGRKNEIGCENGLIWPIREDLKHFKNVTMGHPVIMGRKTWESLPKAPLPGRLNVVVTRNKDYQAPGALVAPSLEEAVKLASKEGVAPFVIGGGSLYREALPLATRLHLTCIDATEPSADTWFPEINPLEWVPEEISETMVAMRENDTPLAYHFETYRRKNS